MGIPPKENPFLVALRGAKEREESHYQRQEVATREFFARHPENLHEIFETEKRMALFLPWQEGKRRFIWDFYSLRREACVDIEQRFGAGWWERVTDEAWIGLPQQRGERKDWRWEMPPEESYWQSDDLVQMEMPLKFEVA